VVDALKRMQASDPTSFAALGSTRRATPRRQGRAGELRDLINGVKDFPGITGVINFDANRNPVKPAVVIKVENGVEKFAASIAP
jgi:branched-chain amino acid transport system substrate-binding protein